MSQLCWCGVADHRTERERRLGITERVYTYQCDRCGWRTHGLNDYLGHRCPRVAVSATSAVELGRPPFRRIRRFEP